MTIDLDFSRDEQAILQQHAAALGTDVRHYVLEAVREKIGATEAEPELPANEWHARLERFAKRHQPTGYPLDDSRESIYADRI